MILMARSTTTDQGTQIDLVAWAQELERRARAASRRRTSERAARRGYLVFATDPERRAGRARIPRGLRDRGQDARARRPRRCARSPTAGGCARTWRPARTRTSWPTLAGSRRSHGPARRSPRPRDRGSGEEPVGASLVLTEFERQHGQAPSQLVLDRRLRRPAYRDPRPRQRRSPTGLHRPRRPQRALAGWLARPSLGAAAASGSRGSAGVRAGLSANRRAKTLPARLLPWFGKCSGQFDWCRGRRHRTRAGQPDCASRRGRSSDPTTTMPSCLE